MEGFMFGGYGGNDDFVKKIVRIFAEEFIGVLRHEGYLDHFNDFLSIEDAAEVLGFTREKMLEMIKNGTAPRRCKPYFKKRRDC